MAAVTVTVSAALGQPKGHHVGVQALRFTKAFGATAFGTIGDTLVLGKIPNRATVLDCMSRFQAKAATGAATLCWFITKGNPDSDTSTLAVLGSLTTSNDVELTFRPGVGTGNGSNGLPFQVSLSDDDGVQYALLKVRFVAGTETTSFAIDGWVSFAMNAQSVS